MLWKKKISQKGINLIKHYNNVSKTPYENNLIKIGISHVVSDSELNKPVSTLQEALAIYPEELTVKEINELFKKDLDRIYKFLEHKLRINVNQNQFDGLCCHTFRTNGSTGLIELLNSSGPDSKEVEFWWKNKFVNSTTKCIANDEYNLFKTGELKFTNE